MRAHLSWWSDWPAVLRPSGWNWMDFTVLSLRFEHARYLGNVWEFWFGVLGVNVELTLTFGGRP